MPVISAAVRGKYQSGGEVSYPLSGSVLRVGQLCRQSLISTRDEGGRATLVTGSFVLFFGLRRAFLRFTLAGESVHITKDNFLESLKISIRTDATIISSAVLAGARLLWQVQASRSPRWLSNQKCG